MAHRSKSVSLTPALYEYLVEHGTPPDAIQRELIAETHRLGGISVMQVSPDQGSFMTVLTRLMGARWVVEVGTFVDSGTVEFNPCTQLLERGITIIGSFDNEAEHFVRALPLVADPRIPLEKLITHRLPLGGVQRGFEAVGNGNMLNGKEIVKIAIDPTLPE